MEKNMETTIAYWGYIGDNGKENGNYDGFLCSPKPFRVQGLFRYQSPKTL